jgi:hypothetical protein
MFCMKAHQLSIVLPSKSILVQLRIHTCYTKTCIFPEKCVYFDNDPRTLQYITADKQKYIWEHLH